MTSNGMPFQTAVRPPPRNVGTPDSADTPAPVKTSTFFAAANRSRSSAEIIVVEIACITNLDRNRSHGKRVKQSHSRVVSYQRVAVALARPLGRAPA